MAEDLQSAEEFGRRSAAVSSVRQVMHALWAVSRANYARAERSTADSVTYYSWIDRIVERLAGPPLRGAPGPVLRVVLGPERALCGSLVSLLLKEIPPNQPVAVVGDHFLQSLPKRTRAQFTHRGASNDAELEPVAHSLASRLLSHAKNKSVELVYARAATGEVHHELLLAPRRHIPECDYDSYTDHERLLTAALSQSLEGRIAHSLGQTLKAELSARIQTAHRARQACDDALEELTANWRALRQEQVTMELSEVSAALASLSQADSETG